MELENDLFTNIPLDIIIVEILTRLAVRDITRYKCVCKSWLDVLGSPEFVKLHTLRSRSVAPPFLAYQSGKRNDNGRLLCEILELADAEVDTHDEVVSGIDIDKNKYYRRIFRFLTPIPIHSSVDGLLFFCNNDDVCKSMFVMNPFTRDRFEVPAPTHIRLPFFGFGVSKESREYKIVGISQTGENEKKSCHVITLGETSWRSIPPPCSRLLHSPSTAFLNGKLHWLVHYVNDDGNLAKFNRISVFDFETEVFTTFCAAPALGHPGFYSICALEGCACLCRSGQDRPVIDIDIWLMKEYGNDNSWTKIINLKGRPSGDGFFMCHLVPLKLFKNGDMLMAMQNWDLLCYYSSINTTFYQIKPTNSSVLSNILLYTPSFLSPRSFLPTTH